MKVMLFDIDGTLMLTGRAGLHAIRMTLVELYGIEEPARVAIHGQTDRGIARALFQAHQLDDSSDNWDRFRDTYARHLEQQLPIRDGTLLPGVRQLLENLSQHDNVAIGLLTGNIERGARLKLAHYEVDHFFQFGGFGDGHAERNDVAAVAKRNAEQTLERELEPNAIWVIGDTPNDIRCGQSIGANVLAVATGETTIEELQEHKPTAAMESLADFEKVAERLLA